MQEILEASIILAPPLKYIGFKALYIDLEQVDPIDSVLSAEAIQAAPGCCY